MPSLASDIEVCKAVWIWRVFALIMGVYSFYWDSVGTLLFDVGTDCWYFLFGHNPTAQKEYLDSERGLVKTQFCQLGGELGRLSQAWFSCWLPFCESPPETTVNSLLDASLPP